MEIITGEEAQESLIIVGELIEAERRGLGVIIGPRHCEVVALSLLVVVLLSGYKVEGCDGNSSPLG